MSPRVRLLGRPHIEGDEQLYRRPRGMKSWLLLARPQCAARSMEELRQHALRLLADGDASTASAVAGRAAGLEPLDENAQELFIRSLVAAGRAGLAAAHLTRCEETFAREG